MYIRTIFSIEGWRTERDITVHGNEEEGIIQITFSSFLAGVVEGVEYARILDI